MPLFQKTFFILGILLTSFCHAQNREFGLGSQIITESFRDPDNGKDTPDAFHSRFAVKNLVYTLNATQAIHFGQLYLGLFENLQWQTINCTGRKDKGVVTYNISNNIFLGTNLEEYNNRLTYTEKRNTLGLGIDAGIDFTPHKRFHSYIGLQFSLETPVKRNVIHDEVIYQHIYNSQVLDDSTYKASPYLTFKTSPNPVFSLYLKESFPIKDNFGVNFSVMFNTSNSIVEMGAVTYNHIHFIGSISFYYFLTRPDKPVSAPVN